MFHFLIWYGKWAGIFIFKYFFLLLFIVFNHFDLVKDLVYFYIVLCFLILYIFFLVWDVRIWVFKYSWHMFWSPIEYCVVYFLTGKIFLVRIKFKITLDRSFEFCHECLLIMIFGIVSLILLQSVFYDFDLLFKQFNNSLISIGKDQLESFWELSYHSSQMANIKFEDLAISECLYCEVMVVFLFIKKD